MILTDDAFHRIFPKVDPELVEALNLTLDDYHINTRDRCAAFLAQVGHESADLTRLVENLNYSAERLAAVWPSRYRGADRAPNALAFKLAHNPEALARGAFMTTGKTNYADTGRAIALALIEQPDLLEYPQYALEAAGWYWSRYALNRKIDAGDFKGTTRIINGGQIGADDRQARYIRAAAILKGAGL
jgi:putative chitinase